MKSKTKDVIFITEGGSKIGLGHLMRCIAVAEEVRRSKLRPIFIVNNEKVVIKILKNYRFCFRKVSDIKKDVTKYINGIKDESVLIDSKRNLSRLINKLQKNKCKVTLVDNPTNARFLADNVVYPGEYYRPNRLCGNKGRGKVYYGAKYFPLRKELRGFRKKSFKKKRNNILISFGGADPNNLTLKVLKALKDINNRLNIKVLIGPAFKKGDKYKIFKLARNFDHKINIIDNDFNFKSLLNNINLCITAFGISVYEFNYFQIPTILLCNYRDDIKDAIHLECLNIAKSLGYHRNANIGDIREGIKRFIEEKKEVRKYVDGKGAERIARLLLA